MDIAEYNCHKVTQLYLSVSCARACDLAVSITARLREPDGLTQKETRFCQCSLILRGRDSLGQLGRHRCHRFVVQHGYSHC